MCDGQKTLGGGDDASVCVCVCVITVVRMKCYERARIVHPVLADVSAAQQIGAHLHALALTDWLWRGDVSRLREGEEMFFMSCVAQWSEASHL